MRFKYIGTGAKEGIPSLFCACPICTNARVKGGREHRHRSSALLDEDLLIDLSPDTFSQAIAFSLNLSKIKYILFTHTHPDHFYIQELANARPPYALRPTGSKISVFASGPALAKLREDLSEKKVQALAEYINFIELTPFKRHEFGDYAVTPLMARHNTNSPFIYMLEKEGRRILYANDSGFFPEETWDFIAGLRFDFVTLDCTHGIDNGTPGHMCIEDNITVKRRMFQQGNLDQKTRFAATHFSHTCGLNYFELDERLRLCGITTAYDGLEIKI